MKFTAGAGNLTSASLGFYAYLIFHSFDFKPEIQAQQKKQQYNLCSVSFAAFRRQSVRVGGLNEPLDAFSISTHVQMSENEA